MQVRKSLLLTFIIVIVAGAAFFFGRMTNSPVVLAPTEGDQQSSDTGTDTIEKPAPTENISVAWTNPTLVSDAKFTVDPTTITYIDLKKVKTYKVGTVSAGTYIGNRLLLAYIPSDGICFFTCDYPVYLLETNGAYKLLGYYGSGGDWSSSSKEYLAAAGFDTAVVSVDSTIRIPDLALPAELHDTVHNMTLVSTVDAQYRDRMIGSYIFDTKGMTLVYNDSVAGPVYTTTVVDPAKNPANVDIPNGFYVRRKDGTLATYQLQVPFLSGDREVANIVWNDQVKNESQYSYQTPGGCGMRDYLSIISIADSMLMPIGKAPGDVTVYTFKNQNDARLKAQYDNAYKGENNDLTYEKFIAMHPMFLWKDPLGRWVAFYNRSIGPAAECGKPVIYLYPTTAQNVSVKLAPQGGFSKTEPAYGNGWNVFATPEGVLTNLADNLTYPYLFWEGTGGAYETPDKGWVVKGADVHSFLVSKLAALGLNQKETGDFIEFWEPRMQGSPYYFITFLGNTAMNRIAPLTVKPAPDTVIRILMDYTPLAKPMKVEAPIIRTPERIGFTLVEWGGVLR